MLCTPSPIVRLFQVGPRAWLPGGRRRITSKVTFSRAARFRGPDVMHARRALPLMADSMS